MATAVWLARSTTGRQGNGSRPDMAETEILLRHRYASGEIDDDEYHRRLATLRGQPNGGMSPS